MCIPLKTCIVPPQVLQPLYVKQKIILVSYHTKQHPQHCLFHLHRNYYFHFLVFVFTFVYTDVLTKGEKTSYTPNHRLISPSTYNIYTLVMI